MSAPDPLAAFAKKLAACIRLLTSNRGGEVDAAAQGIVRMLLANSGTIDLHAVAERLETPPGMNEATKEKIRKALKDERAAGYAEGVRAMEAKQGSADTFRSTSASAGFGTSNMPDWRDVARYVQREKSRVRGLNDRTEEFIDDMASRTVNPYYNPSSRQLGWLNSLFLRLGGKIT